MQCKLLGKTQILYTDSGPAQVSDSDPKSEPSNVQMLQKPLSTSPPWKELERIMVMIVGSHIVGKCF